ncbi:MAG: hypothetical protein VB144_08795 [Clostridia bacterium]|nr:hypothetical protein [Clostridia bacterium]
MIVEATSYCCAQLPFESASEIMERLSGISVSPKEAQILSEEIGAEMDKELEAQAAIAVTDGLNSTSCSSRLYDGLGRRIGSGARQPCKIPSD